MISPQKPQRPIIAPDVIVDAVSDKANWKTQKAKPHAQNKIPQIQVSAMPSTRILTDSRERAKPASSITNPTCIQKTRYAATSVHTVLIAFMCGGGRGGAASAYAEPGK